MRVPVFPVSAREASWLISELESADGFSVVVPRDPLGWDSDRGVDVGRTRPDVFHADPFRDDDEEEDASAWYEDNDHWWCDEGNSNQDE